MHSRIDEKLYEETEKQILVILGGNGNGNTKHSGDSFVSKYGAGRTSGETIALSSEQSSILPGLQCPQARKAPVTAVSTRIALSETQRVLTLVVFVSPAVLFGQSFVQTKRLSRFYVSSQR